MKAARAITLARGCRDVTYEEWCDLYVKQYPTADEVRKTVETARVILVRNGVLGNSELIDLRTGSAS